MRTAPAAPPTLSLRSITKHFDAVAALTDVTFDVLPGEVHALLGENGAGKSTLMNVASGATAPDEGTIVFEGTTVEELEQDFRDAVDDYLDTCTENGVEPQKPYSGKFVLRLSPEIHRDASIAARRTHSSMNRWILGAIQMRLAAETPAPRQPEVQERLSDAAGG